MFQAPLRGVSFRLSLTVFALRHDTCQASWRTVFCNVVFSIKKFLLSEIPRIRGRVSEPERTSHRAEAKPEFISTLDREHGSGRRPQ
jgi:hypothetical protein